MRSDKWERLGAASGLMFFALVVVLFFLASDQPSLGASASEVFRYQVDNQSSIQVYLTVWSLAVFPLLWFLGTLIGVLRRADRGTSPLPTIAAVGVALGLSGIFLTIILEAAAAFRPDAYGPELTRLLWDMSYLFIPVFGVGLAAFLAATAALIVRTKALPGWLGWLTLIPVAANLVYVGQLSKNDGYFLGEPGFPAFVLWIPLVSVLLLRAVLPRPATQSSPVPGMEKTLAS
ncbi:MAG: hypothetical protein M3O70_13795 [Actinomycetota bacterium]|nr:hypothetical protein [Actinomycetota bacterium]